MKLLKEFIGAHGKLIAYGAGAALTIGVGAFIYKRYIAPTPDPPPPQDDIDDDVIEGPQWVVIPGPFQGAGDGPNFEFMLVPTTTEEWKNVQHQFELQWNLPNCCGALDGKHIRIVRPPNSSSMFYNYKHTYSIVLFAMVDADYCFKFIDVGSDGRANDSTIFKNSELNIALERNLLNWPSSGLCVGDDAFPLRHNLLTPFSHRNLNLEERIFNYRLSRARRVSENAFGILASRFRVFTHSISLSVDTTELVVKAACALHNFLRQTSAKVYFPPGSVDTEDLNTGEITLGAWRTEVEPLLSAMVMSSAKNYSNEVKRIQTFF